MSLVLGQLAVIGLSQALLPVDLPLGALGGLLGLLVVSNLAFDAGRRRRSPGSGVVFGLMALDVVVLTAALYLTGGPTNPFSSLYLVYVAWAAVVFPSRLSWALSALAFAGFGLLFFDSRDLVITHHGHDHGHDHTWHLQGMWLSFGLAAVLIVYFVQRLSRAIADRDAEVARLAAAQVRAERLASLATLAAGAAHELATPLSTIAVVAKELERGLAADPARADATDDARLVRTQVQRCRDILDQMSADAGEAAGEPPVIAPVSELVEAVLRPLDEGQRARVRVTAGADLTLGPVPRRALARGLRGLVVNGLHASPEGQQVELRVRAEADGVRFEVQDRGAGMPPEVLAHLGEPFHTTKAPGEGMGLGVFLMRSVAERLGGRLDYDSTVGEGTTARVQLPGSLVSDVASVA